MTGNFTLVSAYLHLRLLKVFSWLHFQLVSIQEKIFRPTWIFKNCHHHRSDVIFNFAAFFVNEGQITFVQTHKVDVYNQRGNLSKKNCRFNHRFAKYNKNCRFNHTTLGLNTTPGLNTTLGLNRTLGLKLNTTLIKHNN